MGQKRGGGGAPSAAAEWVRDSEVLLMLEQEDVRRLRVALRKRSLLPDRCLPAPLLERLIWCMPGEAMFPLAILAAFYSAPALDLVLRAQPDVIRARTECGLNCVLAPIVHTPCPDNDRRPAVFKVRLCGAVCACR